ncbi:hypothetical protein [Sphingomonas colocasiae]|uniref:Uncharacterized protein n=1 Tax=Sphingomonas colocasiae TaxID=1848973 RepID=A0ABS7PMG9_9SPHN|nr:hypothetical protein [Sphingomonas colocasiae]MBY8822502.1 hypothetical protein [Sphingomonas colocasiae]
MPVSAWAQTGDTPPVLDIPAKDLGDARKYVLFHKPGVTAAQAEADLAFCWRFLARGVQRRAPGFVPWHRADAPRQAPYAVNPYGLVGDAIGAIIAGPLDRSVRQSRLYRCMLPRGYVRYRTSETVWKQLNSDDAARSIRLQALIAAGPNPPTPRVAP